MGDKILINIANLLKTSIRKSDFVARWGGEEFIILLINTQIDDAEQIAENIRKSIEKNTYPKQNHQNITISLGLSLAKEDDDVGSLFKRADDALYQAKSAGKNCVKMSSNE
jgi:diguanylate cyclase (GGDEF)-like protein